MGKLRLGEVKYFVIGDLASGARIRTTISVSRACLRSSLASVTPRGDATGTTHPTQRKLLQESSLRVSERNQRSSDLSPSMEVTEMELEARAFLLQSLGSGGPGLSSGSCLHLPTHLTPLGPYFSAGKLQVLY